MAQAQPNSMMHASSNNPYQQNGADPSKYLKRPRRTKRMSWTLFGAIFGSGCFILVLCLLSDYFYRQNQLRHLRDLKRAHKIMEERGADGLGSKMVFTGSLALRPQTVSNQRKIDSLVDGEEHHSGRKEAGFIGRLFGKNNNDDGINEDLRQQYQDLDHHIRENIHGGIRWVKAKLLKELPGQQINRLLDRIIKPSHNHNKKGVRGGDGNEFAIRRKFEAPMEWEKEWNYMTEGDRNKGPKVDYTKHQYKYPDIEESPPDGYPFLETMGDLMKRWPQDDLDHPPTPFVEKLMHFNYSDPKQLEMARVYRDAELPFKLYNVPEVTAAGLKWTDEYVASNFDKEVTISEGQSIPRSKGNCQESVDNFFAFFTPMGWRLSAFGPPPYRNNDWTFEKWSTHARYADSKRIRFDQPHFYWQSGVPKDERDDPPNTWSFVSRDLPSFSSPTETFFVFHPKEQKGIQCRFGERGVTAATHYDAGRNMVAMMTGAKRYILSPPKECSKLGIVTARGNTLFRHSLLNFGHISHLGTEEGKDMPSQERAWLERSSSALALDTVLKAGEVLYIPSHWFHYITSLQKSAQCNVRSGVDELGSRAYGGAQDVYECKD